MNKFVTVKEAADKIHDGMTVMVGGFLGVGNPIALIDELVARNVKDLTIICNDTAYPEVGVGKLITNHQVKALIATHIGTNNNTIDQMNAGELKVTLQPQGTLAEQIRAAGAGLLIYIFVIVYCVYILHIFDEKSNLFSAHIVVFVQI